MRRFTILLSTALFCVPIVAAAQAIEQGEDFARFTLGNDLYTAGNVLEIGNQPGDLLAAGNKISINGVISGDLQAIGSSVMLNGTVRNNVRIAGGDVTLHGTIDGNVVVFGGTVVITEGTTIKGSLLAAGGSIVVNGTVKGNVRIDGTDVRLGAIISGTTEVHAEICTLNGKVGKDAMLAAKTLKFGEDSRINGNLKYWQKEGEGELPVSVGGTASFDPTLGVRFSESEKTKQTAGAAFAGLFAIWTLYVILAAAVTIIIFQILTKTLFEESARRLQKKPAASFLWGLLYFFTIPPLALILLITIIGIPLTVALTVVYILSLLFAKIIAAMVLARWAEHRGNRKWHGTGVFFASLGFYIALKVLGLIPVVGWIACCIIILWTFGANLSVTVERVKKIM